MADEFEAVPSEQWWRMRQRIGDLAWLFWLLAGLFALLVLTLIDKGVLSGWSDLFATAKHMHE